MLQLQVRDSHKSIKELLYSLQPCKKNCECVLLYTICLVDYRSDIRPHITGRWADHITLVRACVGIYNYHHQDHPMENFKNNSQMDLYFKGLYTSYSC